MSATSSWILSGSLLLSASLLGGDADEKARKRAALLNAVGRPLPVKGFSSFLELTYRESSGKKRSKEKRAFLKLPEKFSLYRDHRVRLEQIESGDKVYILGRPIARDVPQQDKKGNPTGRRSKDRQIQNARVIVAGDAAEVNREYQDRKDKSLKWCEAEVILVKGGLWVKFDGHDHRVTVDRKALIVKRETCDREILDKARAVHVVGGTTSERPDTGKKSDSAKPSFRVKRIVVIDRGLPGEYSRVVFP